MICRLGMSFRFLRLEYARSSKRFGNWNLGFSPSLLLPPPVGLPASPPLGPGLDLSYFSHLFLSLRCSVSQRAFARFGYCAERNLRMHGKNRIKIYM